MERSPDGVPATVPPDGPTSEQVFRQLEALVGPYNARKTGPRSFADVGDVDGLKAAVSDAVDRRFPDRATWTRDTAVRAVAEEVERHLVVGMYLDRVAIHVMGDVSGLPWVATRYGAEVAAAADAVNASHPRSPYDSRDVLRGIVRLAVDVVLPAAVLLNRARAQALHIVLARELTGDPRRRMRDNLKDVGESALRELLVAGLRDEASPVRVVGLQHVPGLAKHAIELMLPKARACATTLPEGPRAAALAHLDVVGRHVDRAEPVDRRARPEREQRAATARWTALSWEVVVGRLAQKRRALERRGWSTEDAEEVESRAIESLEKAAVRGPIGNGLVEAKWGQACGDVARRMRTRQAQVDAVARDVVVASTRPAVDEQPQELLWWEVRTTLGRLAPADRKRELAVEVLDMLRAVDVGVPGVDRPDPGWVRTWFATRGVSMTTAAAAAALHEAMERIRAACVVAGVASAGTEGAADALQGGNAPTEVRDASEGAPDADEEARA